MHRFTFYILLVFALTLPAYAANHYVRIGATGTGSGSDWTNACPGFTGACAGSSLVRGDTYYVASGSYPSPTFSTADNGTLVITIKKATVADHGTSVGWSDSFGTGAATFRQNVDFNSNFWVFDGVTGGGPDSWKTGFGFVIDTRGTHDTCVSEGGGGRGFHHLTLRHFECIGDAGGNAAGGNNYCAFFGPGPGPILVEYLYCHDVGAVMLYNRSHALTAQYSWFDTIVPDAGVHAEGLFSETGVGTGTSLITKNITIRYTVWKDVGPPSDPRGVTGVLVSQCDTCDFYGNVFINSGGGQGCVTTWNFAYNVNIYNNTFVGCNKGVNYSIGQVDGSNIRALNNLFYDTPASFANPNTGGTVTHDFSWCGLNSGSACTGEANDQNAGTGNPFVNLGNDDYHLVANTAAWSALASPYNQDLDGEVRSSSRGAYEFVTGSRPQPPTGVSAKVN